MRLDDIQQLRCSSHVQARPYSEVRDESSFELIGLVNASSDAGMTEQGSLDYAVAELKKQAAKLGANGVLLVSSGESTTGMVGGVAVIAKTVQGKAIFIKPQ